MSGTAKDIRVESYVTPPSCDQIRYHIWDTKLVGFGQRVERSGTKPFVVCYCRDGGGRYVPRRFVMVG
jgi:hypothetical protein